MAHIENEYYMLDVQYNIKDVVTSLEYERVSDIE